MASNTKISEFHEYLISLLSSTYFWVIRCAEQVEKDSRCSNPGAGSGAQLGQLHHHQVSAFEAQLIVIQLGIAGSLGITVACARAFCLKPSASLIKMGSSPKGLTVTKVFSFSPAEARMQPAATAENSIIRRKYFRLLVWFGQWWDDLMVRQRSGWQSKVRRVLAVITIYGTEIVFQVFTAASFGGQRYPADWVLVNTIQLIDNISSRYARLCAQS
jgi:hypothetical protein